VKRYDEMTPMHPTRETHVAYNANEPTSRDQNPVAFLPHFLQSDEKRFIIFHMPKLIWVLFIALQCPIGG